MLAPRRVLAVLLVGALVALTAWWFWPGDERAIRARLDDFSEEFNASTPEGAGTVARAVHLGSFFTDDVVVEFGPGTAPIRGRDTLIGMAARLQPRTSAFSMELKDVNVAIHDGLAEVNLTAVFRRRTTPAEEESLDAREFELAMVKSDGAWRVSRVAAVETIK